MKYIFVTGSVVSRLGKGICAASLGRLLSSAVCGSGTRSLTCTSTWIPAP